MNKAQTYCNYTDKYKKYLQHQRKNNTMLHCIKECSVADNILILC